jgi:N-acetyl-alpha-D-muramate 1-phosphate uridylyltransferase
LLQHVPALASGAVDAHLVLTDNPAFHPAGDMALAGERIDPDGSPRLTYANIGAFAPRLFAGLSDSRAKLFPWLYRAARAGRVSGEHAPMRWFNIGTADELARVDHDLAQRAP